MYASNFNLVLCFEIHLCGCKSFIPTDTAFCCINIPQLNYHSIDDGHFGRFHFWLVT